MIKIHHLNDSRSQRILWLLEELGLDYEIIKYERNKDTRLAPQELNDIHPLGKSPVLEDGDIKIHESAAITDYLIRTYGDGNFSPAMGGADYETYNEWMHYAEGSAMLPLLLKMYCGRLGDAAEPIMPRINSELMNHFSFMNGQMEGKDFFMGDALTGADFMMSFPLEAIGATGALANFPNLDAFVKRIQARPAYLLAIKKGGYYVYGPKIN